MVCYLIFWWHLNDFVEINLIFFILGKLELETGRDSKSREIEKERDRARERVKGKTEEQA